MPKEELKFPVKILDDLYVCGILNADDIKKKQFLKSNLIDKMDMLIENDPAAKKVRVSGTIDEFFTSTFGDFIISDNKDYIRCKEETYTLCKSEELFMNLVQTCGEMNQFCEQMIKLIYKRKGH